MRLPRPTAFVLLVLDALALFAVFNAIGWVRGVTTPGEWITAPLLGPYAFLVFATYLIDGYNQRTDMLSLDYASQHGIALLAALAATMLLTYAVIPSDYPLQTSRAVTLLSFASLLPVTLGYRRFVYLRNFRRRKERVVVFIGDRASCAAFAEECARNRLGRKVVYSTFESSTESPTTATIDVRPFASVLEEMRSHALAIEAFVLRESAVQLPPAMSRELLELYFQGVPTYTLELFHEIYWRKIPLYRLNQVWIFQHGFQIAREPVFERMKRVADVVLAGIGLVLAAPLLLLCGMAVWLEDRGPIFFRQRRVGKNRVPFTLVKLRTMRPLHDGSPYTGSSDRRITKVGQFLRQSRLDELPQLWNVLTGDMSLIGPRAEWDRLVREYDDAIPCYHFRHLVRPGITGWAQVNYPYGAGLEDTLRKLEYDLYYIRHFSFVLDAAIVLKTIHVMLFGKGR